MENKLSAANVARANKILTSLIRTSDYGVVSYQEFVTRRLASGGRVAIAEVEDSAKRAKLEREYALLNRVRAHHARRVRRQALFSASRIGAHHDHTR